jgi:hypothetical protein
MQYPIHKSFAELVRWTLTLIFPLRPSLFVKCCSCVERGVGRNQLDYYWSRRSELYIPDSQQDQLIYSAYKNIDSPGFNDPSKLVELAAVYYAMVEEVDHHGPLKKLIEQGKLW